MHLCSDVKWSFQSQLDLVQVQLKWTSETKLLFCFPSYFVTSRLSKSISSIHSYEFLNRSCIVPHVFSGWTENYFSSNWKVYFFRKGQILTIYLLSRWDGSIAFGATTKTPSLRADGPCRQQHPYSWILLKENNNRRLLCWRVLCLKARGRTIYLLSMVL